MYRFVERLTPEDLEAIAAFAYMEMLEAGFTSVAEFHYLHHQPDGRPYDNVGEMSERIVAAADTAGIGLTLLPVLYRQGGFLRQGTDRGPASLPQHARELCAADGDPGARRRHRHRATFACAPSPSTISNGPRGHGAAGPPISMSASRHARSMSAWPRTRSGRSTCCSTPWRSTSTGAWSTPRMPMPRRSRRIADAKSCRRSLSHHRGQPRRRAVRRAVVPRRGRAA